MNTTFPNRLHELLSPAFSGRLSELLDTVDSTDRSQRNWSPPTSIWEEEDVFRIEVDLPGVAREAIELTFEKDVLTISAERVVPEHRRVIDERRYGRFSRKLSLPESADAEAITAEFTDGVLRVTIGKQPEAQPRKIEVKVS